jgi:hypothetical protein
MTELIRVDLGREVRPGVFEYTVSLGGAAGSYSGLSRQPLLDACRGIKRMGGDTAQRAGLFREGRDTPDMVCSVGWGSGKTVSEPASGGGPKFVKYHPFAGA